MDCANVFNQLPTGGALGCFTPWLLETMLQRITLYINHVPQASVYLWDRCWAAAQLGQRVSAFVIWTDTAKGARAPSAQRGPSPEAPGSQALGGSGELGREAPPTGAWPGRGRGRDREGRGQAGGGAGRGRGLRGESRPPGADWPPCSLQQLSSSAAHPTCFL